MNEYKFTLRDPVHGFIGFNDLERDVINSPAFQRLRRVRQLAWTDHVYPGAMHTRFEHSMGVCHVATRLFDAIIRRDLDVLRSEYKFESAGVDRQRQIIRLAALLHDLGHGPFSHAAEEVFPQKQNGEKYLHEEYSSKIAIEMLSDLIENHPLNTNNYGIRLSNISDIFLPDSKEFSSVLWKEIISGQMDADRMDYLLRDSYHSGVSYGRYDLDRVIDTIRLCEDEELGGHVVGVAEDGIHAVEGLLIARFMMFTQVYFHKTRVIYDYHYEEALKQILAPFGGAFPPPVKQGLAEYFDWDDWRVLSELRAGNGGAHGERLLKRQHYRLVYQTPEIPNAEHLASFDEVVARLDDKKIVKKDARKSWYKFQNEEIRVRMSSAGGGKPVPLATLSPIVNGLATVNQRRIYVPPYYRSEAERLIAR